MRKEILLLLIGLLSGYLFGGYAQDKKVWNVSGSIQTNVLIPQKDKAIGATGYETDVLSNSYADVSIAHRNVEAGVRMEYMKQPLPGFEVDFKGWGVPHAYVKGKYKGAELTLGTFYEQFGSGFVLRAYEERSLGVDNALLGARLVYRPLNTNLTMKLLCGKQRSYWSWNDALLTGGEAEYAIAMGENRRMVVGASYLRKDEKEEALMADPLYALKVPTCVEVMGVKASYHTAHWQFLAEGALKSQDPSLDNGYIYRKGYVGMLSATYSKKGMSVLAQMKRSDNMGFRSKRSIQGMSSYINHLPPFTLTHSYALPAIYPYATQPDGEWAYQASAAYRFKPRTTLGGKYGMQLKLNFSYVRAIEQNEKQSILGTLRGSDGYGSAFWKWGRETFYQDLNLQLEKRLNKSLFLKMMYMNLIYNKAVIEGKGDNVRANIVVADLRYSFTPKMVLRTELQHLATRQDEGNWWYGMAELSLASRWMFSVSDMYNSGVTKLHYYQGYITYSAGAHRLAVGYGRTRAGYNCAGGVCRYIPSTKGLTVSYNYSF